MPDLCIGATCGERVMWIAVECKCSVSSPSSLLRLNKQLGNYDALVILLPRNIKKELSETTVKTLEKRLEERLGKATVILFCDVSS